RPGSGGVGRAGARPRSPRDGAARRPGGPAGRGRWRPATPPRRRPPGRDPSSRPPSRPAAAPAPTRRRRPRAGRPAARRDAGAPHRPLPARDRPARCAHRTAWAGAVVRLDTATTGSGAPLGATGWRRGRALPAPAGPGSEGDIVVERRRVVVGVGGGLG